MQGGIMTIINTNVVLTSKGSLRSKKNQIISIILKINKHVSSVPSAASNSERTGFISWLQMCKLLLCGCDALTLRNRDGCASPSWRRRPPRRSWRAETGRRTRFQWSWPCCWAEVILQNTHDRHKTQGFKKKYIVRLSRIYCILLGFPHRAAFEPSSHMFDIHSKQLLLDGQAWRKNTIKIMGKKV